MIRNLLFLYRHKRACRRLQRDAANDRSQSREEHIAELWGDD